MRKWIPLVLLCALAAAGCARNPQARYDAAIETARTEIWKDINSGKAGSATVAIMDNGRIVYAEGFGMADREKSIPVDRNTIFNMGSIGKVFTAAAIMLLVDQGKVALDDPVIKHLPEFVMADPRYKGITVRMTLNHTSGLPGSFFANDFGFQYNESVFDDLLKALQRSHLRHAPGEMAVYTNDGFTLAEMIVERVSGKKFIDFLAEQVFTPLSLRRTGRGVGERHGQVAAAYYEPDTGKREPLEVLSVLGAGGLSATAEDLVRFADTFSRAGNKIFSTSALEEMNKAQPPVLRGKFKNPDIAFGLGFDVTDLPQYQKQGVKIIGKSGGTGNYNSMLFSAPEHRLSVAVIESGTHGGALRVALATMDALLAEKGLVKRDSPPVSRPIPPQPVPQQYAGFDGYYLGGSGLLRAAVDRATNRVNLFPVGDDPDTPEMSLLYRDDYLTGPERGQQELYFASIGPKKYLVTHTPLGDLIFAEKLEVPTHPQALRIDLNGKRWLRRNVKPFESVGMAESHVIKSARLAQLPGYARFGSILVVNSPDFAGMPVASLRDQMELWLLDRGGQTWVQLSDLMYSPDSAARALTRGENTATIAGGGYNEWLRAGEGWVLRFNRPARGRVIVFSPGGKPIYDSAIDQGDVYVPRGSLVEFAGQPGDVFQALAR